jgi:hypothetical protein
MLVTKALCTTEASDWIKYLNDTPYSITVFFTYDNFTFDTAQDVKAVLFPPVLLLFFFFAFTLPAAILFYYIWSANAALLFVATIFAYYLNYEWLHFAYHLPKSHFIAKLPLISTLRKLHHTHHNIQLMTKYNFNITYPIFDLLFGTYYKENQVNFCYFTLNLFIFTLLVNSIIFILL